VQNIASFLADTEKLRQAYVIPTNFSPGPPLNGGLRLPPFELVHPRGDSVPPGSPKHFLSVDETAEAKTGIFAQLDTFDAAPFTIQRLAELCVRPRANYSAPGKYLRALERIVYVTSSWASFPPLPPAATASLASTTLGAPGVHGSPPSTPLFSPISFLHGDARARSRSPPPSPLVLGSPRGAGDAPAVDLGPALGLVDELDDPSPGHLSERPTALSSVTSLTDDAGPMSLQARFVSASSTAENGEDGTPVAKQPRADGGDGEAMAADEQDGDKENKT